MRVRTNGYVLGDMVMTGLEFVARIHGYVLRLWLDPGRTWKQNRHLRKPMRRYEKRGGRRGASGRAGRAGVYMPNSRGSLWVTSGWVLAPMFTYR